MIEEQLHHDALLETARSELENAHAAALAMVAGDIRRSLQLALDALTRAAALPGGVPYAATGRIGRALAQLDAGQLADMENELERARSELNA